MVHPTNEYLFMGVIKSLRNFGTVQKGLNPGNNIICKRGEVNAKAQRRRKN